MNEDDDMSAEGIAVCSVVESESEEENDEPEQEQFDTVADAVTPVKKKKERKTFSIAHQWLDEGNAVLVHIDLETGGEQCGVVQLSSVIYDVGLRLVVGEFNKYVRPPDDAVWNSHACVHCLSASSESIKSADTLVKVWTEFVKFIEKYTSEKMGIIEAWGGKSCDVKWMWRITVAQMAYNSYSGGGLRCPSSKVSSILHSRCIVDLFCSSLLPIFCRQ